MAPAHPEGKTQVSIEHAQHADIDKPISQKVPRKTLKAITLKTGEPADAETGFTNHTVLQTISCAMSKKTVGVNPTHHFMTELMKEHLARLLD